MARLALLIALLSLMVVLSVAPKIKIIIHPDNVRDDLEHFGKFKDPFGNRVKWQPAEMQNSPVESKYMTELRGETGFYFRYEEVKKI
ncbi:hypothetical protein Ddc_14126 [Ditylenchus destructor]|nr:hypothetical protein Ddc_14126 [Ditylenchus destructor]